MSAERIHKLLSHRAGWTRVLQQAQEPGTKTLARKKLCDLDDALHAMFVRMECYVPTTEAELELAKQENAILHLRRRRAKDQGDDHAVDTLETLIDQSDDYIEALEQELAVEEAESDAMDYGCVCITEDGEVEA